MYSRLRVSSFPFSAFLNSPTNPTLAHTLFLFPVYIMLNYRSPSRSAPYLSTIPTVFPQRMESTWALRRDLSPQAQQYLWSTLFCFNHFLTTKSIDGTASLCSYWRVDFSRVEWRVTVVNNTYQKVVVIGMSGSATVISRYPLFYDICFPLHHLHIAYPLCTENILRVLT